MSDFITVEEARKLVEDAKSLNGTYMRAETEKVFNIIRSAAEAGKSEVWIDGALDKVIIGRLFTQRFAVNICSDQHDPGATISWSY